ncbi:ARM repeat-containing protein [Eremomyces bilateralis CBS 781.70]|uniref:ARM repeat-containing protein n=1 Tax=Eremomyces bilateralis CBS 781.70 TaxID=1392243 RepID=A0A6G1GHR6_9PEZI|nr:ARM repeat-containing protein [Eremomyces bilateralis CBS 781.70]KAF1817496.1 ARM repeat-containing protein [Eremomyces bilateralis CBS 781.70]
MEQETRLAELLAGTHSPHETTRSSAEAQLQQLYSNDAFPMGLVSLASHNSFPVSVRQSALLYLKTFVLGSWTSQFDEFKGEVLVSPENKEQIRQAILHLATGLEEERKIKTAASLVVSRIAQSDFPEEWPGLLDSLLHTIQTGSDAQLHGALRVMGDLVDDCLNEEQFFRVAPDLVQAIYNVAVNESRKTTLRALAVNVFRACFDILEMVVEDHKAAVKAFADETLRVWIPFFLDTLRKQLPLPPANEEGKDSVAFEAYRGFVALKLQVVKVLMRVRSVFPSNLAPHSPTLFSSVWEELNVLQSSYSSMYIENEHQSRLEDADNLPYTLDFLVLEDLDFMQACLRAQPVKKELEKRLFEGGEGTNWLIEVVKLAVEYAQITTEEEGMWNLDVNVFLSEETSVTANYTPRTACGDLVIKLGEWQTNATVEGLLSRTRSLYSSGHSWKGKEAALYILNQLLIDFQDTNKNIGSSAATGFVDFIRHAMGESEEFLRARGYLVAGSLIRASGETLYEVRPSFMEMTMHAMAHDSSELVKVSCIRALQCYLSSVSGDSIVPVQNAIVSAISDYYSSQDFQELAEGEDIMVTIVETLRDTITLDARTCVHGTGLDLLFSIASHGASNYNVTILVEETFVDIVDSISRVGGEAYVQLCGKVLPSLMAAIDIGNLTEENALTNLASNLLNILTEQGSEPLPQGFVATVMPKLNRLLLNSSDEELLRSATSAVKNMLIHDYKQVFEFRDESNKGGLEVVLIIIDRLLSPSVDENAAEEVGGMAAEVVEKAGAERLGPYLMQLLRAVAIRLGSATKTQFMQSLILVFARLSLQNAQDVVEFLAQVEIGGENGLQVVMSRWLENSVNFTGYDEIRQNVIALSKLYNLNDPRLSQQITVKGDLIVDPQSDRIMTRSRARKNPDQFTIIPAQFKIIKVLVEELSSASGGHQALDSSTLANLDEAGSDDDEWEDEPDTLDLGAGMTKEELMRFGDDSVGRVRDDQTQAYLTQFFREVASKPGFTEAFNALTPEEQDKLRSCS